MSLDRNLDAAVLRTGTAHEETIRDDRPYCGVCGYCDVAGANLEFHPEAPRPKRVRCTFCEELVPRDSAYPHQRKWVGECCWDERLRMTE